MKSALGMYLYVTEYPCIVCIWVLFVKLQLVHMHIGVYSAYVPFLFAASSSREIYVSFNTLASYSYQGSSKNVTF